MNASSTAGLWGDLNCDPPHSLLLSMFDAMANVYPPPDFGFLTGDDPPHNVWNQTRDYNVNCTDIIVGMVRAAFPSTTFFPALGNHNGFPVNQYNIDIADDQEWLYFPLAGLYSPWLNADSLQTFKNGAMQTV